MEGLDAQDSHMTVDIVQIQPLQQAIAHQVIQNFNGQVALQLEDPEGFPTWQVTVSLPRFDPGTGFFFQPRGEPNPSHTFQAARLPSQWTPQFALREALTPARFTSLTNVIAMSNAVDLKNGPPIGDLNANYDNVAGSAQVLAKTALLNLYAVLTDEQDPIGKVPWFSYVRKIVRMDQERFLAEVDPALFENVQTIINKLTSTFAAEGFFTEPAADLPLHIPNIPPGLRRCQQLGADHNGKEGLRARKCAVDDVVPSCTTELWFTYWTAIWMRTAISFYIALILSSIW